MNFRPTSSACRADRVPVRPARAGVASLAVSFAVAASAQTAPPPAAPADPCAQPPPAEMAKAAGVELPRLPWHVADLWWDLEKPVEHFESLEMDVTIDRNVPSTYNLYLSPVGLAKISGRQFYGGLQTNINGWPDKTSRERVHPGRGAIFSRWAEDLKTPLSLDHVRMEPGGLCESAGYEGSFASVRRPYAWTKGAYTYIVARGETETAGGTTNTWFHCRVRDAGGTVTEIGALRFEGADFTYWDKHSAFVEVYSTAKVPRSGIPKVVVSYGWPRINGKPAPVRRASVHHPASAPDCATARAEGPNCVVEVGPIFKRDPKTRHYELPVRSN